MPAILQIISMHNFIQIILSFFELPTQILSFLQRGKEDKFVKYEKDDNNFECFGCTGNGFLRQWT